jgi:O-antigen ligase
LSSPSTLFDLRHLLRHIGALLSFEAIFILFLASVNYKADPRFSWFPIDLTVIFFVLGVAMGLAIVWREGIYLPGLTVVSLLTIFIAWVLLTTLWTPGEIYARQKMFKLATLNLWSVIATAMIMANRRERVRRFLLLILVFCTAACADGIVQYATAKDFAFSASYRPENYLGQGRFYALGALVAFAAWLQASPFSKRGVALMAAFVICFWGLLVVGSRGPTLGVLAGMLLPLALGLRFADRRLLASKALVTSVLLLVLLVVALWQGAQEYSGDLRTLQRLNILFTEEGGGGSAAARVRYWIASWHMWLQQPLFGSGVGSFPMRMLGKDINLHPHNLILEVLLEFGLIGLLLLAAVIVAAVRRISVRRLREDFLLMCVAMLCINTFFYAMTSSDITENRNVFAMMGLLVMRPYSRTSPVDKSRARDLGRSESRPSDLPRGTPYPGRSSG